MLYVRYPLSLRNVEDLAFERGIDICHETVRKWVSRFGPMFAAKIRKRRVHAMRQHGTVKANANTPFAQRAGGPSDFADLFTTQEQRKSLENASTQLA